MNHKDTDYYHGGIVQYSEGNYEGAIEFFNKGLEINPKDADMWYEKGRAFYALKKYKEAMEAYNKVTNMQPDDGKAWHEKGATLCKLSNYKKAVKAYDKAIDANDKVEINKGHALPWIYKAFLYYELKEYEKALKAINRAIKIYENDKIRTDILTVLNRALAWNNKGSIFSKLGKFKEATKAYKEAITVLKDVSKINSQMIAMPEYTSIYLDLGELFLYVGNLEGASKTVEDMLKIDENYAPALNLQGRIKIEEHEYDCAISSFNKAITLDWEYGYNLLLIAYANYLQAEFSSSLSDRERSEIIVLAIRKLEKAEKVSQKEGDYDMQASSLYFLGYFYYKSKDLFTAKEKLEQCVRIKSGSSIRPEARELLKYIWNYQIRPTWFDWWFASPLDRYFRRCGFIIISLLVSALFFIHPFIQMWVPGIQINWTLYTFFISLLIFIMIFPSIERIRLKEMDVVIHTPPSIFVLSPARMEEKLKNI